MTQLACLILGIFLSFAVAPALAQTVEVKDEAPATGRERAAGYFKARQPERTREPVLGPPEAKPRYLAVHAGTFFTDQSYKWGKGNQTDLGKLNIGVDYRLGEWINTADFALRVDFTGFELDEGQARKISVDALVSFPDANSRFPLYFGVAVGPGFFLKQIHNESVLSLDYSLLAGARMFDVVEHVGFMVEVGLKDHLLLFSDGQFNGLYFNVGTVFAF